MRKLWIYTCMALVAVAGCKDKNTVPAETHEAQADSLSRLIDQKDQEINDMMGTLNEIQDGFRAISEAENRVTIAQAGEGADRTQQIKENIRFIAEKMQRNRTLIAKLKQQLRESSIKGEEFTAAIESLTKELQEKDSQLQALREELDAKNIHISELDETINNLNTNVNSLKSDNAQKDQTISSQDHQLNTAWFVFGTKKELQGQRIMDGSKVMQGNFNKNYFTKIDIRDTKEIKLYSKSAEIKTIHPGGSYTLERDANKQYVLRITNPQLFWSASKYLVILVK